MRHIRPVPYRRVWPSPTIVMLSAVLSTGSAVVCLQRLEQRPSNHKPVDTRAGIWLSSILRAESPSTPTPNAALLRMEASLSVGMLHPPNFGAGPCPAIVSARWSTIFSHRNETNASVLDLPFSQVGCIVLWLYRRSVWMNGSRTTNIASYGKIVSCIERRLRPISILQLCFETNNGDVSF